MLAIIVDEYKVIDTYCLVVVVIVVVVKGSLTVSAVLTIYAKKITNKDQ